MRNKVKELDLSKYKYDPNMSTAQRAADCLNWCAIHFPKQYVQWNKLYKAINDEPKMPQLGSDRVERLRGIVHRIGHFLKKDYKREHICSPGAGIRATVDSADVLTTVAPRRAKTLSRAKTALATTLSFVDEKQLPNTPEMEPYKKWLNKSLKDVMRLVNSDDFTQKLLPPAPAEGDKE